MQVFLMALQPHGMARLRISILRKLGLSHTCTQGIAQLQIKSEVDYLCSIMHLNLLRDLKAASHAYGTLSFWLLLSHFMLIISLDIDLKLL